MKLSGEFEIVNIGGEIVAISVGEEQDIHGIVKLKNNTSKFIFEQLQNEISFQELIKRCLEKYPNSTQEQIEPAVKKYIDGLQQAGLVTN